MQSYLFEQTTSSDMIPDIDLILKNTRKSNELKAVIFEVILLSTTQLECL